jgi:hypothetical protein
MLDDTKDRFWPRSFSLEPLQENPVSFINEPVREDVTELRPGAKQRPLHAVLVESLTHTRALLTRLEGGVRVPRDQQRETVRALYVATRNQLQALVACLELEGLE